MKTTAKSTASSLTTKSRTTKSSVLRPKLAELPTFTGVDVATENIWFHLSDGRTVIVPLAWSKPLENATLPQRQAFKVSAYNVFWDEIDEIIGVENVLYGKKLFL